MKKQIIQSLSVIALMITSFSWAQQTSNYTFWRQNLNLLNPAYAGSTDQTEVQMSLRDQWNGVKGAPSTQSISGQTSLSDKVGFGLSVEQDQVFIQRETNFFVNVSYKLQLKENHDLYLGLKAGASYFSADFNQLQTSDPINQDVDNKFNPNFGLGAYYTNEKFFVSLSVPRLLKAKRYEEGSNRVHEATDEMLVMLGGGYYYTLNESVTLIPALMTRYVSGAPFSFDASFSARFYDKFELGANYRWDDSFAALAMLQIVKNTIDVGFAYEFTTSDVSEVTTGGPEILLRVSL